MKTKNKVLGSFWSLAFAITAVFALNSASADLDKNFRENFTEIVGKITHSRISYSLDDDSGFIWTETPDGFTGYKCQGGKCLEYKTLMNCMFNNALEESIKEFNQELRKHTHQNFAEIKDIKINTKSNCVPLSLKNTQTYQENNGFKTSCEGELASRYYSACRVSETMLNELWAYQNYLKAKINDRISHVKESSPKYHLDSEMSFFKEKIKTYEEEIDRTKKTFDESTSLYKNIIHNYRISSWLKAIKFSLNDKLNELKKIEKAIETFPAKFNNATVIQ